MTYKPELPSEEINLGHNSGGMSGKSNSADAAFKAYIARYQNLEVQKSNIADDQKELTKEIKNSGIDLKAFKRVIKELKIDADKREADEQLFLFFWDKANETR